MGRQEPDARLKANRAESDDRTDVWQRGELRFEMGQAVPNLLERWLVVGRRASDSRRDVRIAEPEAIFWVS